MRSWRSCALSGPGSLRLEPGGPLFSQRRPHAPRAKYNDDGAKKCQNRVCFFKVKIALFKYQKHGRLLDEKGFRFPTDLLAHFGAVQLLARIENDRAFRAWQIPSLFEECLLFPLTSADRQLYEEVIGVRNDVAHGKAATVTLQTSLRYASELHTLAAKVDHHVAEHFLVIQTV
jgi:hypothetical protein